MKYENGCNFHDETHTPTGSAEKVIVLVKRLQPVKFCDTSEPVRDQTHYTRGDHCCHAPEFCFSIIPSPSIRWLESSLC